MTHSPMNLSASRVLAIFSREGDRFTHRVVQQQDFPEETVGLHSVCGTSLDDWPLDPPMQQLVLERVGTPARTVALGVGMSGSGHWSLASEVIDNDMSGKGEFHRRDGIQFDWACRIHRPAERLGSSYRVHGPLAPIPQSWTDQRAEWSLANGVRWIVTVSEGRIVWNDREAILSIVPVSDIRSAGTHTWRYCFGVE